jgi:hypothetical protein
VLAALAGVAAFIGGVFGAEGTLEAWMPPAAGALALLPFACVPPEVGRRWLGHVLVANAATVPAVLAKRLAEGSEFLRLNVTNLNVNSTALIYALAFCGAVDVARRTRARRSWCVAILYAGVVLVSGSRTAAPLLVVPWCTVAALRRIRFQQVIVLMGLAVALAFVAATRIDAGEEYGSTHPPVELEGGSAESLGVVGRAWSFFVGWEVVQEYAIRGTQSVEGAVAEFQARGFYSFAHSTLLMLVIVYGVAGVLMGAIVVRVLMRIPAGWGVRLAAVSVVALSGGLVTNPKELALTCAVVLVLLEHGRVRVSPRGTGSLIEATV